MNKKINYVFGAIYISLISMYILYIVIIIIWNNTLMLSDTPYSESFEMFLYNYYYQNLITFLAILIMIPSIYSLFIMYLKLSSIFGLIGNTIHLMVYFSTIRTFTNFNVSDPDELILINNVYGSISVFYLLCICLTYSINIIPILYNSFRKDLKETDLTRKIILDLGTKHPRLQTKEIAEACKININAKMELKAITRIIREMIKNNEIHAQYFKSTNSVAFDQQANIDEIDTLMNMYTKWEEKDEKKE